MQTCQLKLACVFSMLILSVAGLFAQTIQIKGTASDNEGVTLPGVSILVKGTTTRTITDVEGHYSIAVPGNQSVLVFSYIGYQPVEINVGNQTTINVVFNETSILLDDLVVIGYGTVKKKDLTGSVTQVSEKEFQKGVATPDRMILGKVAGVQVTPNGGAPGSGSRIRIRGASSLSANNDPLIIIDGVPLENSSVAGSPSLLSTLNPNDIESMNILKDASATAIYGNRASNGIIIITTKQAKYGQKTKVEFSTQFSTSTLSKSPDVLSADQIRNIVTNSPLSNNDYRAMLGTANTNWQDEIYQTSFGTDNNLTISGATATTPYRFSFGYLKENGVLKSGSMERFTVGTNLNPRYFDDKLKIDISLKGSGVNNKFANTGAIEGAMGFDPTQSVRAPGFDKYGGYYTWLLNDGSVNTQAFANPVALLNTYDNTATVLRGIASGQADYRMHFLPELRANLNLSYDYAQGYGNVSVPEWASYDYNRGGRNSDYGNYKTNKLFEFYLNYAKQFDVIKSFVDLTAGYTYQDWLSHNEHFQDYTAEGKPYGDAPTYPYDENQHTLISFFGRLNYSLMDKYLLTATIRRDGSSRFAPDVRWGNFPSVALAWHISEEGFLKNISAINDLKLRFGYGETGQQDIANDYGYIPYYRQSNTQTQYQFGDRYYYMYRPEAYDEGIRWESTATTNVALDYAIWNNRIYGSLDFYIKKSKDLLNWIDIAAGTNFSDKLTTNIGDMENKGMEFSANVIPVQTKDWNWDIGFNLAYNKNKITKLTMFDNPNYKGAQTGGMGYGTYLQMQSVGYPLNSFFLYRQIYNENGNPLEGVYADLDENGTVNDDDKRHIKSSEPILTGGLSTTVTYKKWSLSTGIRGSYGNYIYNGINAIYANYGTLFSASKSIVNVPASILESNFRYQEQYSDYYLENASFLKMDNLSLTYNFGKVFNDLVDLRGTFGVQNVFTITKYSGPDPEIANGIDRNFYLRPRIFALGFNLTF